MVGEKPIVNMDDYNLSMSKSMIDKMFFMDKIDDDVRAILDFGCADGALIRFLAPLFPSMTFIGYDLDPDMIEKAKAANMYENCVFFSTKKECLEYIDTIVGGADKCALNMSSVIHEVYSYGTDDDVKGFWNFVIHSGFAYIVTRDMCLDRSAYRPALKEDMIKIRAKYPADLLHQFEDRWGCISENGNMIHFLLKYRYKDNWEREVEENYLPVSTEEIAEMIGQGYELEYFDHYILPYTARKVKEDFDITLKDYTHVKFIYRKKERR